MGTLRHALTAFLDTLTSPASVERGDDKTSKRTPLTPLTDVPAPSEPAEFLGAETFPLVPGYVFLNWHTTVGLLAAAYPTTERHKGRANHVRQYKPDIRVLVEPVELGFHAPDGPDVRDHATSTMLWRHYAHAIGRPAPFWPHHLNHRHLIEQWQPGDPIVTTMPTPTPEPDPTPLLQLAALYPPDSTTAAVLRHYYLALTSGATEMSRVCYESLDEERDGSVHWNLADILTPAARAVPHTSPGADLDHFTEGALRAVFADIIDRRDTLGEQVVLVLSALGVDQYFPFTSTERYQIGPLFRDGPPSAEFEEWRARLEEVPARAPDARFGQLVPEPDEQRFTDPATGAPVTKRDSTAAHPEGVEHADYATLLPRRLPTTSPLAELILDNDGQGAWVRTDDGMLYPMPCGRRGYAWGYRGSGSINFTVIVEKLLDDIAADTPDRNEGAQSPALEALFQRPRSASARFSRTELEQTRNTE